MILHKVLITILLICGLADIACSQASQSPVDVFVSSTPCDAFIKSSSGIPATSTCEFIKWEHRLFKAKGGTGQFQLTALYGESQPNTNGFKGGGKKITVDRRYTSGASDKPATVFYRLQSDNIPSPLYLVKLDDNIFHFADSNKKLLVGNGGWGYVLNRLKQ